MKRIFGFIAVAVIVMAASMAFAADSLQVKLEKVIECVREILNIDPHLPYGTEINCEVVQAPVIRVQDTMNLFAIVRYGKEASFVSCNAVTCPVVAQDGNIGHLIHVDDVLIDRLNNDELMAIVAHELGHIHHGHPSRRLTALEELQNSAQKGFWSAMKAGYKYGKKVNTYNLDEYEADFYAVEILERMGLSPALLSKALEKIQSEVPEWAIASDPTHPDLKSRIHALNLWAKMH